MLIDPAAPLRGPGGRLELARELLGAAQCVAVFTGAGISAESGVPTFRGADGWWRRYRPQDLANPLAFRDDPLLVWSWYAWRRELIARCEPNAAHYALARCVLESAGAWRIITQNVDGLHQRAIAELSGVAPGEVPDDLRPLALHGEIFRVRCSECGHAAPHLEPIDATSVETLPCCPECGALTRPAVVWFGESLDNTQLQHAMGVAEHADVGLVIGTSGLVQPAASLPHMTRQAGGRIIEVNPDPTPLTELAELWFASKAALIVPELLEGLAGLEGGTGRFRP